MRTDRFTAVPHTARRALGIALLVVLLGTLAAPAPTFADEGLGYGVSAPDGLSRPLDGVGDSPVMP